MKNRRDFFSATRVWQFDGARKAQCDFRKNCAFVQMHGFGETACPEAAIFICAGARGTSPIYKDPELPVNRVRDNLRRYIPKDKQWFVRTSGDDPATIPNCWEHNGVPNVFGRLLNGVPAGKECKTKLDSEQGSGYFVHIEQWPDVRTPDTYDMWVNVFTSTFAPL